MANGESRRRVHVAALAGMVFAAAVLNAVCSFNRYYTFKSGTYDLVIFDQAVRSYSRWHLPVAIVKGVHNGFGPRFSVLGDHFSPILALLAPLYRISDGPQTLLAAQAVLFAAAIVPLWTYMRRELGAGAAYCVAGAYALSWPVAQAVAFDFHEVAFAPLLTAIAFERLSAYRAGGGRLWHIALVCLALILVKEDMGLLVAGLGLGVLVDAATAGGDRYAGRRRKALLLGAGCVLGGTLATVVITQFVIPAFGGRSDYYWAYSRLGPTPGDAAWHLIRHPLDSLHVLVDPTVKVHTTVWLLALAGLTPLVSPYLLVVLPLLAERMFADSPNWWGLDYHYNAFLVVALLCAGVDGIGRMRRVLISRTPAGLIASRLGSLWAVVVLAVALFAVPRFAFGALPHPETWRVDADMRAQSRAIRRVPDGAMVEAASSAGPHLTGRTRVLLWDRAPRGAPWVIADVQRAQFPFCGLEQQRARVAWLEHDGYRQVFEQNGYIVLHRPDAVARLSAPPAPACG
jgi:uncharacterized membrane protein